MTTRELMEERRRARAASTAPKGATAASFVLFGSLAALLAMVYAAGEWWHLAGGFGLPSDAAWVRMVFARNVASGEGLCFNPGTPAAGVAAPLWIVWVAAVGFVTGSFLAVAKVLGLACLVLTALVTWRVILDLVGDWRFAFLGALVVAASPRLAAASMSGTEAALAGLLVIAAIHLHAVGRQGAPERRALRALVAGLAALCRPELVLIPPLLLVDRWLAAGGRSNARRSRDAPAEGLLEFGVAALALAPYVWYNWRLGGPLWQQPVAGALAQEPAWLFSQRSLVVLWRDNPFVLCAAVIGLPVVALAAARAGCAHRSFLVVLTPLVLLAAPGLIWRQAGPENAGFAAAYLTPVVAVLGVCGLFAAHRAGTRWSAQSAAVGSGGAGASSCPTVRVRRAGLGVGIGLVCGALVWFSLAAHSTMWREHGFQVRKANDLQGYIGRWAGEHLPVDASIASRELGAIGFFSRRRMVDLGGTISQEGVSYLRRPGPPDSNLLGYLEKAQPSHLAIRPADFPDLSQRGDLLKRAVTCMVTDPSTGGLTTMALYETLWPAPSVRAVQGDAERH